MSAPATTTQTFYLVVCTTDDEDCYSVGYFHSREDATRYFGGTEASLICPSCGGALSITAQAIEP